MLRWIKEGEVGDWSIKHFEIDEQAANFANLRQMFGGYSRPVREGWYTGLYHKVRGVVMSDTPAEVGDLWAYKMKVKTAHDTRQSCKVHISGLGLGICAEYAARHNHDVEVIEIDPDVIALVGVRLMELYPDNVNIIQADALNWKPMPDQRYGIVWHDIWDTICTDDLIEHTVLSSRFARRTSWQGLWCHDYLVRQRRRDRYQEEYYNAWR